MNYNFISRNNLQRLLLVVYCSFRRYFDYFEHFFTSLFRVSVLIVATFPQCSVEWYLEMCSHTLSDILSTASSSLALKGGVVQYLLIFVNVFPRCHHFNRWCCFILCSVNGILIFVQVVCLMRSVYVYICLRLCVDGWQCSSLALHNFVGSVFERNDACDQLLLNFLAMLRYALCSVAIISLVLVQVDFLDYLAFAVARVTRNTKSSKELHHSNIFRKLGFYVGIFCWALTLRLLQRWLIIKR